MLWLGVGLTLLLALIAAALCSNIYGNVYFSRVKDNDQLSMDIRALFGLVRYRFEVPIIQFRGFSKGVLVKSEMVNASNSTLTGEHKEHITRDKVVRFYRRAQEIVKHTVSLTDWIKQTLAHLQCTHLSWQTRVGVGDAPETAITTGAVWALKSSLLGFLLKFIDFQAKPNIQVIPQYNQMQFATQFTCKAHIRLGFALWAGIRLLARIVKEKGGMRTWYRIVVKPRLKAAS